MYILYELWDDIRGLPVALYGSIAEAFRKCDASRSAAGPCSLMAPPECRGAPCCWINPYHLP